MNRFINYWKNSGLKKCWSIFKLLVGNYVLELEVIRIFKEEQMREAREGRSLGVTISSSCTLEGVRMGNLIATGKASKGKQYENYLKNGGKLSIHEFFFSAN